MAKYELVVTSDDALSSPLTLTVLNSVGPRGPAGPAGPTGPTGPAGATTFADLTDVDSSSATIGQLLQADGDDTFSFVTVAGATNTLDDVTNNGNTTTNSISVGGVTATSLNTHTIPGGTSTLALTSDIPTNNNQLTNGAGYITDYTVTQGDVTAHQAALSITESQISDLGAYLTAESDTLDSVTDRGSSTTNGVTVGSLNTHTIPGGTGTLALTSDVPTNNNQLTNGAGYITDYTVTEADVTAHQAALSITESQISDFGTYATLVGGTVPASQLPSYVDDVEEYTNYASFPASGETGKIYVDLATGDIYRWSGSAYVQINDAVSSADQATRLATARTISLGGDVSGSASFDGSANVTITAAVADDSHNHIISNVDGLQTALDGKLATTATTDDVSEGSTNLYYTSGRFDAAFGAKDTDDLSEGLTNLYYTDTRATSNFNTNLSSSDTDDLSEGLTNLYYTDTRATSNFNTNLAASDTGDLSEGTNLYYTDARVLTKINATSIDALSDVDTTTSAPSDGQVLTWDNTNSYWKPSTVSSGGGGTLNDVVDDITPQLGGNLDVNGNSIVSVSGGDIAITPNADGQIVLDGLNWPTADGTDRQVLVTDGSGELTFDDIPPVQVDATNNTGSSIAAGTPVYQTGVSGQNITIAPADASSASTMPAIGVTKGAISASGGTGVVVVSGFLKGINTSTYTAGDTLYVANGGGFVTSPPAGEAVLIENLGKVVKSDASAGSIIVTGAGRANATPNLNDGNFFLGNASNQAVSADFTTSVRGEVSATDAGGDGSFSYDSSSGVFTYTGPSAAEVRAHLSTGGDLSYDSATGIMSFTERTDAEVRGLFSVAGDLGYNSTTGQFSFTERTDSEVRGLFSVAGDLGYNSTTGQFSFTERTASEILTDLKTVDGAASGLDADLLDGQHGSYYLDWANTTNKPDPTITLGGDLSGSVTLTDLASGTLTATIGANSVALGTDTTGNYVADVDGTANQIDVSYTPSEGGTPTIGLATNVTTPGNLIVSGDLTVNGFTTTIDSTTVAVADSLFKLAKDNTADSLDAGWYGVYNDGTEKYAGIARDASDSGKFILYDGLQVEPTTTVNTAGAGFNKATLKADIEGVVTGTVSSLSNHDTDNLSEGATNLYYTNTRFDSQLATKSTDNLTEGSTNLYYTSGRFDAAFGAKDTDDLSEGATNLYYTNARADARVNLQTGANLDLSSKSTTDLSEGTNLYYTDTRADTRINAAIGNTVQAHSSVLDSTTASYTIAEETKLAGIEALADVTDTANVVAALTAGTNISIAGDGTISATDTNTTYTAGDGLSLTGTDFDIDLSDTAIFSDAGAASRAVKTDANGEIQDGKGDVRDIPSSSTTGTLVAADAGKFVPITANIAIPASTFSAGEAVTIYNNSTSDKDITSAVGVTAYLAGTATTGTRTLAQRGLATLLCVGTNTFVISGVGLA